MVHLCETGGAAACRASEGVENIGLYVEGLGLLGFRVQKGVRVYWGLYRGSSKLLYRLIYMYIYICLDIYIYIYII